MAQQYWINRHGGLITASPIRLGGLPAEGQPVHRMIFTGRPGPKAGLPAVRHFGPQAGVSDAALEDSFVAKVKLQKQQPMYQPTNAQLIQQPDGKYIAKYEVELFNHEEIQEVANFMVDNTRVILWEVTGPDSGGTGNREVESAPYTRGNENQVQLTIAKGGKVRGTVLKSYA